jgi:CHAD domain-containing protein
MDRNAPRADSPLSIEPAAVPPSGRPEIKSDDPMSEAGRKTLRHHYQKMVYNEPGTRLGEDIEALHDMRVATRRMRAAFRVFGSHYEKETIKRHQKGLKRAGRALGPVRDLDVFIEKVHAYVESLPAGERHHLEPLVLGLAQEREGARDRMLEFLNGEGYHRFKRAFGQFVHTAGLGSRPYGRAAGAPRPYRVCDVAPVTIYEQLAAVRAYDDWVRVPDPSLEQLHALRIACKRLRYTLEFFCDVLGEGTPALIRDIVTVQDHLGAIQDGVVARAIIGRLLDEGSGDRGMRAYLAYREAEMAQLLDEVPGLWSQFNSPGLGSQVAEAVSTLMAAA